jgi:hypothetical protein
VSANRAIPAPPCAADAAEPSGGELAQVVDQYLPSWLASLVVHLSLVLLLALLNVVGSGSWQNDSIALVVQSSGAADAAAGDLDDAVSMPSELDAAPEATVPPKGVDPPAEPTLEVPIKLAQLPLASAASASVFRSVDDGQSGSQGGSGVEIAPVRTAVFGLAAEGKDFVYVFDRSESMNSVLSYSSEGEVVFSITPLDAAKAELVRSLEDLERSHRFGMVFYNHNPWLFTLGHRSNSLLAATAENKRDATAFVATMYAHGKTEHVRPLEIALRMRPDVIFLLTDGEEKDDPSTSELASLRRLNDGRTQINVVQFCFKPRTGGALVQLAEQNGGRHIYFNMSRLGPAALGVASDNFAK